MRIIAGEHRGRRLQAPPGLGTRPMLDRVREALFSILEPRLDDARVLDLFAGTGSLGLEALSRGAATARFVEKSRRTAEVLRGNVRELGLEERAQVVVGDALAEAKWGEPADVVLLDPPYPLLRGETRGELFRALAALGSSFPEGGLRPGGVIVLHAPRREVRPVELSGFEAEERTYGTSALWLLEREAGA